MLASEVQLHASDIWNFGKASVGANLIKVSREQLILTLLPRAEGKFTRVGLKVNRLRYKADGYTEQFLNGGSALVAYNPDDVSCVWIIEHGEYIQFDLIENRFLDMPLSKVADIQQRQKAIVKACEEDTIGECLALTYNDFELFTYYRKDEEKPLRLVPSSNDPQGKHLQGMRVKINKAYVSDIKLTKDPKNYKKRAIPLPPAVERLAVRAIESQKQIDGSLDDRIFDWTHSAVVYTLKKACQSINIPNCTCHDFRHTYISNLIKNNIPLPIVEKVSGDTQATILKRYSHMFESDEVMVLLALQNL